MGMAKYVFVLLIAFALPGCVLQSATPLFTDDQAELVLGAADTTMKTFSWKNGAWTEEMEPLALRVEGRHYVATDKGQAVNIAFVSLGGGWHAIQVTEGQKPAAYMLAKAADGGAILHVLACADLKKKPGFGTSITYMGDDCTARPGVDGISLFKELSKTPDAPILKLVPAT